MKILHVIRSDNPVLGGPSEALKIITSAAIEHGYSVDVATTRYYEKNGKGKNVCVIKTIDIMTCYYFPVVKRTNWSFSLLLWKWFKENIQKYDIVHVHGVFTFPPLAACYWARKKKVPYIIRPLGTLNSWSLKQKSLKKRFYIKIVLNRYLKCAGTLHATSIAEYSSLTKYSNSIDIVPLGVNLPNIDSTGVSDEKGTLHILFLSRIHPVKNLPLLLKSIALLKSTRVNVFLTVAGEGDKHYINLIKNLIEKLNIEHIVRFVGFVQGEDKWNLMSNMDIFVLPSFQESFGIAVVEAMSVGLPVVISDQVAISREVENAKAGYVVNTVSEKYLASTLGKLYDADTRKKIGSNARKLVEEKFSIKKVGLEIVCMYKKVIESKVQ